MSKIGNKAAKILVVDDDLDLVDFLVSHLEECRLEIVSASSGEDAAELIVSEDFDVVVLDIYMPKGNGLEILRDFKNECNSSFVVMSSTSSFEEVSLSLGASQFIAKPFTPQELANVVMVELEKMLMEDVS